jgi:hypothetical protein
MYVCVSVCVCVSSCKEDVVGGGCIRKVPR